ncbi:F420-dependent methylene-tetrahydromethanopterin reductase [Streptomyces cellostaticus]|uniref:F420-dependent methylene-tetrahydromethanopterin reductase n=1 Tax=Streptomyces cellostaticus TaxID=67285 RepID=A0A101NEX6_9ACTN|nr:F420-dependent methylene-tetrahydromethanopterin reductase [Streptomyces cellostaticus]
MHLAARLPGDGRAAVGTDPCSGSRIAFASPAQQARTAERGLFDFLLLSEQLRLPEHRGRIHDLDAAGWPEPLTLLNALAGVTERLGLAATVHTAYSEPYELARRLATLDHLSEGRAAWHAETSSDAFTGANFRHGGRADARDRFAQAVEFIGLARQLWDSWTADGVSRPFAHQGRHFDIAGEFGLPRPPQGHPVVILAGDSDEDRECAAASADVLLARHRSVAAGRAFAADVRRRLAAYGRATEDLKIMSGVTVVLGDTAAEAQERAAEIRRQQITPQGALYVLERVWGADLCGHDPDGPLPRTDPVPDPAFTPGRGRHGDRVALAGTWRALAKEKGLSIRETVIEASGRQSFIGTPEAVAAELQAYVREDAADGFVLLPHRTPGCLEEFVDRVVPLLQERGAFRTEYQGTTLRSHLGLPDPPGEG